MARDRLHCQPLALDVLLTHEARLVASEHSLHWHSWQQPLKPVTLTRQPPNAPLSMGIDLAVL